MTSNPRGLIGEDFIHSVLEKTDIVELIHQAVPLKKAGANYVACCPFHSEKTPSFTVSPSKQFYHCFGCGANGDAINFLRALNGLSFTDAVQALANQLGLSLPQNLELPRSANHKPYTQVLDEVSKNYQKMLRTHAAKSVAVGYLKQRGLTGYTAKDFGIGFAPPSWDNLVNEFSSNSDAIEKLSKLGMIIKHAKGHYYDRFRNRIMFPIRNRHGDTIGFGGRVIDSQDNPKYMNSPESMVFKKGHHLYGIYEAQQKHLNWDTAICVEGYLDVIGLYQHEIYGAFATLGTALTVNHVKQLFKLANKIVFCFDGDAAGRKAAWKALEILFPVYQETKQVRFLFLPEGEDPDSFVKTHGKATFLELIQQSLSLSEYFFSELTQRFPPKSVENRAQLITIGKQYLAQLPNSTYKQLMLETLAQMTSTSQKVVRQNRRPNSPYRKNPHAEPRNVEPAPPAPLGPAYVASGLLLLQPGLVADLVSESAWDQLDIPGISLFSAIFEMVKAEPNLTSEQLITELKERGFTRNLIDQCIQKVVMIPPIGQKQELKGALDKILVIGRGQIIEKMLKTAEDRELSAQEKESLKIFLQSRESL